MTVDALVAHALVVLEPQTLSNLLWRPPPLEQFAFCLLQLFLPLAQTRATLLPSLRRLLHSLRPITTDSTVPTDLPGDATLVKS